MSCNGDDLMKTFNNFNIVTGNVNQNVINGWFDTDCPHMKHLLNWLCTSLTEDNYLSAIENTEYQQLTNVYKDAKLDNEIEVVEKQFPGLFNVESNLFTIELTKDEIELKENELRDINETLKTNEGLKKNLASELSLVTSNQINVTVKKEEAQKTCMNKAEQLDNLNVELYEQIVKYSQYLIDFQFGGNSSFLSNMNVGELGEKFDDLCNSLFKHLKMSQISDKTSVLDITNTVSNDFDEIKNRIAESNYNRLIAEIEIEKLNAILQYLNKYNTEQLFSFIDYTRLQNNNEWKNEQKCLLLSMLRNNCDKMAETAIIQPKLTIAQNELNNSQLKLKCINDVYDGITKILAYIFVIRNLFMQESTDISSTNQFFGNVFSYINKDLKNSSFRTDSMKKVIEEYDNYSSNNFISHLSIVLGTNNDISSVLEEVAKLKDSIKKLEKDLFIDNAKDHLNKTNQLVKNSEKLKKLLVSGPTSLIITIPQELNLIFREADFCLENQDKSLKTSIQIFSNTLKKLSTEKWLRIRRQLWMYFINNPEKLLSLMDEIEEEHNKT